MRTAARIHPQLLAYLDRLVGALVDATELEAVYLVGSAALGAYEPGRSDVDVVAVTSRSLADDERRALAAAVEAIPVPARKLELVVYPRGSDRWEINLNTADRDTAGHLGLDSDAEPSFWFVLDRAMAEQHAVPLLGPPWAELFEPVPRDAIEAALDEAVTFDGWDEASAGFAAARARAWRQTGRWISKPEAEEWRP